MAGMEDFIGGRSAWGAPEYGLYPLANAMVRADTPVVAQVPAQPQGYYANNAPMPGAMQAWQDTGIAPVMYHPNSPYATAAYRVVPDPFGQMAVQPLTGFPSVYPHVLPGVAPNPFQTMFPMLQAMMPPTTPLQWGGAQQQKRASGGGGNKSGTTVKTQNQVTNPLGELQKSAAALNTQPAIPAFVGPPAPTSVPTAPTAAVQQQASAISVDPTPTSYYPASVSVPYDNGMTTIGGEFMPPEENPVVTWRDDLGSLWDLMLSPLRSPAATNAALWKAMAPGEVRPEQFPPIQ